MAQSFTVTFLPSGHSSQTNGDEVLLEVARRSSVRIASACGGRGTCHSCAIRIEGDVPAPTAKDLKDFTPEDIASGWRRACQTRAIGDCTVHVPAKTAAAAVLIGQDAGTEVVPIEVPVLRRGPGKGMWLRGEQMVGPVAGEHALGLAVDLGTTNMAAALIDMVSGRVVGTAAKENPQAAFGADVISRCMHALRSEEEARALQQAAAAGITELGAELTGGHPELIAELAVVGNSVMQHLFLGLSVLNLARAPHQPVVFDAVDKLAAELGLPLAPGAWVNVGPNIDGFVGSDHVAALLETMFAPPPGRWALVDIGTNTEISLFAEGQVTSVSCASGPAFEGGMLTCGMGAAPGAIQRVHLNGNCRLETIGHADPVGICGSGVLSLVAALRRSGAANKHGRLEAAYPLVRERAGQLEFVLADEAQTGALPVVFTQDDVRAVQLAKGAIRAGLDILLDEGRVSAPELEHIIVAGAFGKYIDIDDALAIGLLPPAVPRERIVQVGNSAGAGVRRILACARARQRATELARQAHYLELATRKDFQKTFVRNVGL
jgi:uncharacterized 2Fe-2S/4Fe-4S cluster protein (DUF4445 family)